MKKLLSLLSILTISGNTIPTAIAASNYYEKEENIKSNKSETFKSNRIINLDELIKKAIFFNFRDENTNLKFKEIKDININNLIYKDVLVTKHNEPIINNNTNQSICSGKIILENNLPTEQKLKTSNCKFTIQHTISFQITKGFSKGTTSQTLEEKNVGSSKSNSSGKSSQTGHSQTESSSNSWEQSINAGFSFLGFSIGGSAGGGGQTSSTKETNSLISHNSTEEINNSINNSFSKSLSLTNSFDFSNLKEEQQTKILELELPFQELTVEGNQSIEVNTFLDEVLAQVTLNLKQNIFGEIKAKVIASNNEEKNITLSIKKIMQKLQEYNLLPQEITINNDDSITFNGNASLSYQTSTLGKISIREIETF